jgi:hypothetical protein
MTKRLVAAVAVLALLTAFTVPVFAQGSAESSVRGNLSGTVVDSSGALVTGAKVTITGATGNKSDNTNQEGQFLFPLLTPGFYSVKVEKGSFKTADVKGVEVVTGKTSNLRVGMVAGEQTDVVEVIGSAITVDPTSTTVAANLTDTFYNAVPVGRGVASLFYASPGVASGGGTGAANPSISGGTGLENNYVADGVSITDGGFGGIGVFSRVYGPLSTGINLSFVKEVQVKTGGFGAQEGKSTGGIVQIVTKSGSSAYHGSIGGYFAPQQFEAERKQPDDFGRFNLQGKTLHQANYDLDAEMSGYIPGFKNKLFFFGSFNPSFNRNYGQFAQFVAPADASSIQSLGNVDLNSNVYSYAGKLTFKVNDNHQFESSLFGDPTRTNTAPNGSYEISNHTGDDTLQYGTRNFVVRYNGAMTPSWLVNASWTWGHNGLKDTPAAPDVYSVTDLLQRNPDPTVPVRGTFFRQGLGYFENTTGNTYGLNLDTTKSFRFLGDHSLAVGYRFDRSHYDGTASRSGAFFPIPDTNQFGDAADVIYGDAPTAALVAGGNTNASFDLRNAAGLGCTVCPFLDVPALGGPTQVYVRMNRGTYAGNDFKTTSNYHTLFAQDAWSINKYVTINAGLRWEQQQVQGVTASYTFTDNWSPRLGIAVDPWGNRKTKIYANFGRYVEAMPLDIAIRSLSNEKDDILLAFAPVDDGLGNVLVAPDGQIQIATDPAHFITDPTGAHGGIPIPPFISAQSTTAFAPGTRSQYLDEYVVGFEHEFGNSGVIFTARYTDRRIKRIVEDMAALSPEAANSGLPQTYLIGNPSKTLDIFTNPQQFDFASALAGPGGTPTEDQSANGCGTPAAGFYAAATDSNGNPVTNAAGNNATCVVLGPYANGANPGDPVADGIADGFVNPVRVYKSMEFEVNKSFSKNWQLRANYRIAKLFGNYEGTFRNDNGQSDPNISSLFDFTQGDFNLLGAQFTPGVLNQDVRHLANGFVSYTFGNHYMKGLTMGTSVHFQTGIPINDLLAHPVYQNAGEIPSGGRGSLGRTQNWGQVDFHADYPIRLTERTKVRLAADLFNVTDMRTQLRVDQNEQRSLGVPNADFLKPTQGNAPALSVNPGFQRPFYARFGVKFEF